MDRRSFLKALLALGVSARFPAELATADAAEIDTAWESASAQWGLFEVSESGALSFANFEAPLTRREAYEFGGVVAIDSGEIESLEPIRSFVTHYYVDLLENAGTDYIEACGLAEQGWADWVDAADASVRADLKAAIDAWLDDAPDWNFEWDYLYKTADAQGAAYDYLQGVDQDTLDHLSIVIVEGEFPGSTYYAAELHIEPEEANAISERLGLGLRFV